MKISEFLQQFFEATGSVDNVYEDNHYGFDSEALKIPTLQKQLLQCEEFENTKKLVILDSPMCEIDGAVLTTSTYALMEGAKFGETVYLYSINLTPPIHNPNTLYEPVKDGIVISSTLYDKETWVPYKFLKIEWSPEQAQDKDALGEDFQHKFLERVKNALDNIEEYSPVPQRSVLIKCISSFSSNGEAESKRQIVKLK